MRNCNKCKAELKAQETEMCSTCVAKEQRLKFFLTIAAILIIVALCVALILVLIQPGANRGSDLTLVGDGNYGAVGTDGQMISEEQAPNEAAREEARQEAARILELLKNYTGDDFDLFFTNLMFEYGQDDGVFISPGGYLFRYGDMAAAFYSAAANLKYGEISDLVETSFGVHIIYRIPVDPDAVPAEHLFIGESGSLRALFAIESFLTTLDEWVTDFEPEFTPEYESLNIFELLVAPETSEDSEESPEEPQEEEPQETQSEMSRSDIDFDRIFAKFEPDTPMIVAGEYAVTWGELFSEIYWGLSNIYRSLGVIPDLSEPLGDDTIPLGEFLLDIATDEAVSKLAILYNANLLGIELSDEDNKLLDERMSEIIELYGSEDELLEELWEERGIYSVELLRKNLLFGFLPYVIYRSVYGEEGELFPAAEVLTRAAEEGFIMAKHILISFS